MFHCFSRPCLDNDIELFEINSFAVFTEAACGAVLHLPAFAEDGVFPFFPVEIGAVGEDVEGVAHAVGGGEVGVDGVTVHGHILFDDLLVVGADVDVGQP